MTPIQVPPPRPGRFLRRRAPAATALALVACCVLAAPAPAGGGGSPAEGESTAGPDAEPPSTLAAPVLTTPPEGGVAEAPEGHLLATWEPVDTGTDGHARYQLQIGHDPRFERAVTLEAGADRASFLSGLWPGATHVRVRATTADGTPGPWSEVGVVETAYPELNLVRNLFVLGTVTFACLIAAIVIGVRRTALWRREENR